MHVTRLKDATIVDPVAIEVEKTPITNAFEQLEVLASSIETESKLIEAIASRLILMTAMETVKQTCSMINEQKQRQNPEFGRTKARQDRLREKLAERKKEEKSSSLDHLHSGIELIKSKMEQQEAERALQLERQKASDLMMKKLLAEEESVKQRKSPSKQRQTQPKKKQATGASSDLNRAVSTKKVKANTTVKRNTPQKKPSVISHQEKLTTFALNLCQGSPTVTEEPRVRRWKTTDIEKIRLFKDRDRTGQLFFRYKDLDAEDILEQRARHFLPGTERLLKDPYRSIYAFPTDSGYGFVARLTYQGKEHDGALYIGLDKANMLFHKYFEDVDFSNSKRDIFKDVKNRVFDFEEKGEEQEEWLSSNTDFRVDMSDDGVFAFSYADYDIKIFPLQINLFNRNVSRIK